VVFVHAAHVKTAPGRKTDKADARWLAKLMRYWLLRASVIPPAGQRDLRDLPRYRTKFIQEGARAVNRVQGGLERANLKLASVASDIMVSRGARPRRPWPNLARIPVTYMDSADGLTEPAQGACRSTRRSLRSLLLGASSLHRLDMTWLWSCCTNVATIDVLS
jgi:hypothetical protein